MKRINSLKVGILGSLIFLLTPLFTGAVNTETVGILPANPDPAVQFSDAWFIYKLDLGQSKTDGIRVINNKKETVVVKLYPVDATTTSDGAFALLPEDADRGDVGSWVKLAVSEIEIPPQTEKTVPFEIIIPENADAGDHMGGIIMQEIETESNLAGTGVRIITRVGVRIYETIPGEVKSGFEITKFDWRQEQLGVKNFIKDFLDINKKTQFFVGIKNNGSIRISPLVTVDVKNIFGRNVLHLVDQQIGSVFPRGENSEGVVTWNGSPLLGRYTVDARINYSEGGGGEKTTQLIIWAIPYRIIFLLIILAVIIILGRLIVKYFQEASKEKMPIYTVQPGDTLPGLALKFFVPWHRLAKVNEVGKPFEIKPGEKLFIPSGRKNREALERMLAESKLEPSIASTAGRAKGNRKRLVLIIIFILIGAGALYGIKIWRDKQVVHQEVKTPESTVEAKEETMDKTKAGAFKKSSVGVSIRTLPNGDPESSVRLFKKFQLIGYATNLSSGNEEESRYAQTAIEYKSGKKDQAEMAKSDMGITEQVEMMEVPGLGTDVVIYNSADKNNFLSF